MDATKLPFAAKAVEAALVRKYRNLRTALGKDPMLFVDDIFEMTPISGQVWANSEMEITVSFRPDTAAQYNCLSYLDISGREDRLPLSLSGQGIGPHATLSYDVLDTGDVFINDDQRYSLTIANKGDIPCNWTFLSSLTRFGNKFKFSPKEVTKYRIYASTAPQYNFDEGFMNTLIHTHTVLPNELLQGYLIPGQSQGLTIDFNSDILGEFSEHFRFALQGNEDMLIFHIKGHVVGPTFTLDCKSIEFGTVSYDYLHSHQTCLTNTSKIPMMFNLHIPQDGTYTKKEFEITPCEGVLTPGEFVEILVEFIPTTVKVFTFDDFYIISYAVQSCAYIFTIKDALLFNLL